ncbi:hypothetical protein SOVF_214180, partial [Spinacia oleracea]
CLLKSMDEHPILCISPLIHLLVSKIDLFCFWFRFNFVKELQVRIRCYIIGIAFDGLLYIVSDGW